MLTTQTQAQTQSQTHASRTDGTFDPVTLLDRHGDSLYRYAMSRVHDTFVAEDVVQETLLAVIRSGESFSKKSSEYTWLIGVLKHKIYDHYRGSFRTANVSTLVDDDATVDAFFDHTGHWIEANGGTQPYEPEANLLSEEFRIAVQQSLGHLPKKLAYVFSLREIDGMSTNEISELIGISKENVWVSLHRARLYLRKELEHFN
jgi:RNA polymerase sigma-70 factor (TIGR02943 family)